jgi:UPF0755 protein
VRRAGLALGLALAGLGALGWWGRVEYVTPYRGFVTDEVFVDLPQGAGVAAIAGRLAEAGVVPRAWTFRLAARIAGADRKLKAGEYRFAGGASPAAVLERLVAGDVFVRPVTIPEGLTVFETAALLERAGLLSADAFLAAARGAARLAAVDPGASSAEGYLFPETYPFPRSVRPEDVADAMLQGFARAYDATLRAEAAALGLSTREVVTLASLVEKETARADERPLVSAVYHNRLRLGMPLQCDPTVVYALILLNRWDGNIRKRDLDLASPYNTYRVRGLPPGPIASPGRAALEAAVRPAGVRYLYFVSRNDGSHVFATTLSEHNRNVARFQRRR